MQVIFNMLVEHGVDTVFGYSGGAVSSHESHPTRGIRRVQVQFCL